jgi:hypothetical protein
MANLTVENLSKIVQTGDVEKMFSGGGSSGIQPGVQSDARVAAEMQAQGMAAPQAGAPNTFSEALRNSVAQVNEFQQQRAGRGPHQEYSRDNACGGTRGYVAQTHDAGPEQGSRRLPRNHEDAGVVWVGFGIAKVSSLS